MLDIVMYTPAASGGHARYTMELLRGIAHTATCSPRLVTSRDLSSDYLCEDYDISAILPPQEPRQAFRSSATWLLDRAIYYHRREAAFVRFLLGGKLPHVVHIQQFAPWLGAQHFSTLRAAGIKIVFTVHNVYPHSYPRYVPRWVFDRWIRSSWRNCDLLIVHSDGLNKMLRKFLAGKHPPIAVIPHGVWTRADLPDVKPADRLANRTLIHVGSLRRNKGFEVLIEAVARVPNVRLILAGQPETGYLPSLKAALSRLPPSQFELIPRFVSEVESRSLFDRASLVAITYTTFSAQSGVLFDAISNRVPVIGTNVGAIGDTVRQLGVGEVVAPGDSGALADRIQTMLSWPGYLGYVRALSTANDAMNWRSVGAATLKAYQSVIVTEGADRK